MRYWVPGLLAIGALVAGCNLSTDLVPMPGSITAVTATMREAEVGERVVTTVEVLDDQGADLPGATVNWSADQGRVSSATGLTGNDGRSSIQWTLGPDPGEQHLTASVDDVGSVTFTVVASEPAGS